jgi:ABC-type cobalamin/Fe3+-siderophores transport system ATPase subunit
VPLALNKAATILAATDVVCRRGTRVVLNRVSVRVAAGELLGLVGANGAGKSSLLAVLAGQLAFDDGSIRLGGVDLRTYTGKALARVIGVVPQQLPSAGMFSVDAVALMGRYPYLSTFQAETVSDRRIARRALRRVGVSHLHQRQVSTLSGGERQLVFIARALAQHPRVLLLDEPTANLDWRHQARLFRLIAHLTTRGVAVMAAIHDLELASRHCHRLALLANGSVVTTGIPEDVLTPRHLEAAFGVRVLVQPDPLGPGVILRTVNSYANRLITAERH